MLRKREAGPGQSARAVQAEKAARHEDMRGHGLAVGGTPAPLFEDILNVPLRCLAVALAALEAADCPAQGARGRIVTVDEEDV